MQTSLNRISAFFIVFFITGAVFSQDLGSEMVEVVKPYTPSISDAFKIKEKPAIIDSVNMDKREVQYRIFSFPVASTFSPAKGRATAVERERPVKVYDNYATLGFGSYTSILAEFYSNLEVTRNSDLGIFFTHNSAQGGIEGVVLDDQFYDSELNLNYTSRGRKSTWKTEVGALHQLYNWYGVNPNMVEDYLTEGLDPLHNYFSVYAGSEVRLEDSFFDKARARYRFFGDDFGSAEHHLSFRPSLEIPIAGELFNTNLVLDYVGGSFDRGYFLEEALDYTYLNLGLESGLVILRDDLTLNLGAAIYYRQNLEKSTTGVYIYPQVTASYRMAGEYFVAYAGLEGKLKENTYYNFVQQNPFVSPTLDVQPTDQQYDAYVGAKGKLSNTIGYNLRGSFVSEDFKPLFRANPVSSFRNNEGYAYGNSFSVVYDQVNTISAFGELNMDLSRNFNLRVNAEYFIYDTDIEEEAWNLPDFKASFLADYQITENWFAGANLFLVGERKDRRYADVLTAENAFSEIVTLSSYFDINANLGYRFNDRLSIFAKGNNLLGDNYETWMDYPVLGLPVMAGATYQFDF